MSASRIHAYICSAGHSGSTLLDMMLGTHPSCESLGELSLLPMDIALGNRCGCGSSYQECDLWAPVLDAFARKKGIDIWRRPYDLNLGYMAGLNIDRHRINALYKLKWQPMLALLFLEQRFGISFPGFLKAPYCHGVQNTLELYDQILDTTGKTITVDSTKRYPKAVELYRWRPECTRLIVLVRDARGVYYSGLKRGFSREFSLKSWYNYYSRALPNFRKCVSPEHVHMVRYEDLVTDPEPVLRGICEFLGIDYVPNMLNFRSVVHHVVNGNEMKMAAASGLKLDNAWERGLSDEDYRYFSRVAGKLNRSFGYE